MQIKHVIITKNVVKGGMVMLTKISSVLLTPNSPKYNYNNKTNNSPRCSFGKGIQIQVSETITRYCEQAFDAFEPRALNTYTSIGMLEGIFKKLNEFNLTDIKKGRELIFERTKKDTGIQKTGDILALTKGETITMDRQLIKNGDLLELRVGQETFQFYKDSSDSQKEKDLFESIVENLKSKKILAPNDAAA